MFKFYLPFYYLFFSRLKTKIDLASWIIIFIIPQFILTYIYTELSLGLFLFLFLLSQVIFNTLYEIGYIENDISTTESEEVPTLRLDSKTNDYIKSHYSKIIYFRYSTVFLLFGFLYLINHYLHFNLHIASFLVLLIVNRMFFYWHNSVRNRWNLFTFTILAITKYTFPIVLFVSVDKLFYLSLLFIIIFPLLRIIEHSTHKRYAFVKYANLIGNHDKFRIIYYIFFSILDLLLFYISIISKEQFLVVFFALVYFLLYRVSSYLLVQKGLYKRDNLKNKDLYIK
jgi:hypothetical protein